MFSRNLFSVRAATNRRRRITHPRCLSGESLENRVLFSATRLASLESEQLVTREKEADTEVALIMTSQSADNMVETATAGVEKQQTRAITAGVESGKTSPTSTTIDEWSDDSVVTMGDDTTKQTTTMELITTDEEFELASQSMQLTDPSTSVEGILSPNMNAGMSTVADGGFGFTGVNNGWIEKVNGVVGIHGTSQEDTASVNYLTSADGVPLPWIVVSLDNQYGSQEETYYVGSVSQIEFFGHDDGDYFVNNTAFDSFAEGGSGRDTLIGGTGDDDLRGRGGHDEISGRGGNDILYGAAGADELNGGNGHDTLAGNDGNDVLFGGFGNDLLSGGRHQDQLRGQAGHDQLHGDHGWDNVKGGSGNDTLYGAAGRDELRGGNGADKVYGNGGNDNLFGGRGHDTVSGGNGRDTASGGGGDDDMFGGDGIDEIHGNAGDDSIQGGDGSDELHGGDHKDWITGQSGDDLVYGGSGNDTLYGYTGEDTVYGGTGHDWISGGSQDDIVYGQAGNDKMYGYDGDDDLEGGNGNDTLYGGDGEDALKGRSGHDRIYGNRGKDTLWGFEGNDVVSGGNGDDLVMGNAGNDSLYGGNGNDELLGSTGDDSMYGNSGNDTLKGGDGDDSMFGGSNNDVLFGRDGDDSLSGGSGRDGLFAGYGWDTVTGGTGPDRFLTFDPDGDEQSVWAVDHDFIQDDDNTDSVTRFLTGDKDWTYDEVEQIDEAFAVMHHHSATQDTSLLRTADGDQLTFLRRETITSDDLPDGYPTGTYGGKNYGDGVIGLSDKGMNMSSDGITSLVIHEIGHSWQSEVNQAFLDIVGWTDDPPSGWQFSHIATQGGWYYLASEDDSFVDDYARTNWWEDFASTFEYYFTVSTNHANAGIDDKLDWISTWIV